MRVPIFAVVLAITVVTSSAWADAPAAESTFNPEVARRITTDEVKARLDKGEKIVLIDTRSASIMPVPRAAIKIPPGQMPAWAKDRPKGTWIVTYCA